MRDYTNGLFKLPTKEERIAERQGASMNPIKLLGMLTPMQGLLYFSGWFAWMMDAWDFFSLSLSTTGVLASINKHDHTNRPLSDITTAITLTLLFRSLGAAIFGVISDRYGRKWPLVVNLIIIAVLSLGTGFIKSYGEFLAVRSLFGIGMGGIWGMATATCLENAPAPARGLLSGILQQGYAVGYLFAASANLGWVETTGNGNWRILFYMGTGLSLLAAFVRALLPESELFLRLKAERAARGETSNKAKVFWNETGKMLKTHWRRVIFGILLMTGFNFLSHSSQDLYPTMIKETKLPLSPDAAQLASKATIIGNCGAIVGGTLAGYISQYLGRRLTIVMFVIMTGALIPAWILPNSFSGLAAGAFFIQFGVQGAWGVVPIYLSEISPAAYRATFPGVAYQLGNMVSAASSQIEAKGGEHLRTVNKKCTELGQCKNGRTIPDYAKVSGILLGVVCVYLLMVVVWGKEYKGAEFEKAKLATEAGAGEEDARDFTPAAVEQKRGDEESQGTESIEHVGDYKIDNNSDDEKKGGSSNAPTLPK